MAELTLKRGEKTRIKTAIRILNMIPEHKKAFKGYVQLDNGKICMTNGYMLYIGEPISEIPKLTQPPAFFDNDNINSLIPKYMYTKQALNLKIIKENLKTSKQEKRNCYEQLPDNACTIIRNHKHEKVYFDSKLVIMLCSLIGGKRFTIQVGGRKQPCVIEGETGMGIVAPLNFNHRS